MPRPTAPVLWLSAVVALGAAIAAAAGLFWDDGGAPFSFTTLRGAEVEIYGRGVYRHDTLFKAGILRGTDAATLFVAVPLLAAAMILHRRRTLRGALLLTCTLAYFLYNAASVALGVAYNALFPLYLVNVSASLFAFVLAFREVDQAALGALLAPRIPHRALAAFLFAAGAVVLVWLGEIVGAARAGRAPLGVASYTTEVTYVLDLGVVAPLAFAAGVLVLRRRPVAYLLAAILLVLNALIGVVVVAQTIGQRLSGVTLTVGQLVAFVASFTVMSGFALALAVRLFRGIPPAAAARA